MVLFEGVTPGAVDYSAIVQKIKKSGAETVMFGGYHPEASKIITMMKKKRLEATFISDDGVKDITFIKVAGESCGRCICIRSDGYLQQSAVKSSR